MPSSRPLLGLRLSLVGPGRVGTSLAAWAVAAGAELVATAGRAGLAQLGSEGQDLLLIAVPDGALAAVADRLAGRPQAAVALHTSGCQPAAVLAPLRRAGCVPGALHPLKAFPRALPDLGQARGTFFGLDGEDAALRLARRLVTAWGGVSAEVPPAARPLYHFAATLAAGGVATLLGTAAELAARSGLPATVAGGYLELARGTVAAALAAADGGPGEEAAAGDTPAAGPARTGTGISPGSGAAAVTVLTGPVARGDLATFELHLEALRAAAPERLPLALELARETLRQVAASPGTGPGHRALLARIDELRK